MGVYYSIINETKRQYVHATTIQRGVKYGEVIGNSYGLAAALFYLLTEHPYDHLEDKLSKLSGSWAGDSVYTSGDWRVPEPEVGLFGYVDVPPEFWEDISEQVADDLMIIYGR